MPLSLERIKKSDPRLLNLMPVHYSKPKGFVGRSIHYAIYYNDILFGCISGGSCLLLCKQRDIYFGIKSRSELVHYVNNIFFHIESTKKYPIRNFAQKVVLQFEEKIKQDWLEKYNNIVLGFETLVEPPRTGEVYRRIGYEHIGNTIGYRLRRPLGKKKYDTSELHPKLIFVKKAA